MASEQQTTSLFFYGTLMSSSVLARVTSRPQSSILTTSAAIDSTSSASKPHNSANSTTSRPLTVHPALLPGHRRHRVKGADYPAVVPVVSAHDAKTRGHMQDSTATDVRGSENDDWEEEWSNKDCVRGTCVTGLTATDLQRLDIFEGDEYARRDVEVVLLPPSTPPLSTSSTIPASVTSPPQEQSPPAQTRASQRTKTKIQTQTYIWTSSPSDLDESEWDYDEFVREKMWRWAGDVKPEVNSEFEELEAEVERRGVADRMENGEELGRNAITEKADGGDPTRGRAFGGGFEERMLQVR